MVILSSRIQDAKKHFQTFQSTVCPNVLFWDFPSYSVGREDLGGADSLRRPSMLGKKEINEENLGLKLVTSDSTILEIYQQVESKAENIK